MGGWLRKRLASCAATLAARHDHRAFTTDKNWYGQGESDCLIKT